MNWAYSKPIWACVRRCLRSAWPVLATVLAACPEYGVAQSRAQLPQSIVESPRPNVTQSTVPGGPSSVTTIMNSVQISGPYATSISAPDATGAPLILTIDVAMQRGLRFNLGAITAEVNNRSAQGSILNARSALLPTVNATLSQNVDRISLAAQGFSSSSLPSIGQYFPAAIGPFHFYTAQAQVSHNAFDLVAIRNFIAAKEEGKAASLSAQDAREQVVLAIAATYLQLLTYTAHVQSAEAQVKYAQAVYEQALQQKAAGSKSSIEVNRSRVELLTRQQQLLTQIGETKKQKMALARLIGLSVDRDFSLLESLEEKGSETTSLESLYQKAMQRCDIRAYQAQVRAAEDTRRAATAERLPNVRISGSYGLQGPNFSGGTSIYSGTASLNIPIFNGGQIRSDILRAEAALEQRRAALSAKQEDVRYEVRTAWIDQDMASKQLAVAKDNRSFAEETLRQSIDRFSVGAADSVEIVQSQETLATAEQDYINSEYSLRLAEINLARAIGSAEQDIPKILKGARP